eukprot:Gb_37134 [translate_table: standard]
MPLCISIRKYSCLEEFIIRIVDTRNNNSWAKCKLLIFCKEVVDVLVQNHATNGLKRKDILRPGFCNIQRIKVISVLIPGIHCLDEKLPLRIVACSNGIIEILCCMAVVCSTYNNSLVV